MQKELSLAVRTRSAYRMAILDLCKLERVVALVPSPHQQLNFAGFSAACEEAFDSQTPLSKYLDALLENTRRLAVILLVQLL